MGEILNRQPTKDLQQFQKLIVQDLYIKQLNLWLDELNWENEKKDAIIEMKENEILELKNQLTISSLKNLKTEREFKEYVNKVKKAKTDLEKDGKQQAIIKELRTELDSIKRRLQVSHKMNELLARQNKHGNR